MSIFTKSITRGESAKSQYLIDTLRNLYRIEFKTIKGFSLMEMMVVMLVVAVILALSSPIIAKKQTTDGINREIWDILANTSAGDLPHIGWNKNKKNISAIIGGAEADVSKFTNDITPGLVISTNNTRPHIAFMYGDTPKGTLDVITGIAIGSNPKASASNSVSIGNQANVLVAGVNATAIGAETTARETDAFAQGYLANAGAVNSVAIGYGANVTAANAIAIGNATASYIGSVAIGHKSIGAEDSIVLGYNAATGGSNSVAIGSNVTLNGASNSVAIGYNAKGGLGAHRQTVIGTSSNATQSADDAIVIGGSGIVSGANGMAIGYKASSPASSLALGYNARTKSSGVAIGWNANANISSVAIGCNSSAPYIHAVALGRNSNAYGNYAVTLGANTTAGNYTIAIGNNAGGTYTNSLAIGAKAKLSGSNAVAIGSNSNAGSYAVAVGSDAIANVSYSVALGGKTKATGSNAVALAYNSNAYGTDAVAIGHLANATSYSTALGCNTNATGMYSTAIGSGAKATGTNSIAIGNGAIMNGSNSGAIGKIPSSYQNYSNALVLGNENTTVYIPGTLVVGSLDMDDNLHIKGSVLIDNHLVTRKGAALGVDTNIGAWNSLNANHAFIAFKRYKDTGKYALVMDDKDKDWTIGNNRYEEITCNDALTRYELKSVFKNGCTTSSDRRLKDIIGENLDAMDKVSLLKVYDYTYKKDDLKTPHVGVVAQDLQKIFPNAVKTGEDSFLVIRHEDMFYAMVNALKELDAKIKKIATNIANNLKQATVNAARIDAQEQEIKQLKKEIVALRKRIEKGIKKRKTQNV